MMAQHMRGANNGYNEVIINTQRYVDSLPYSLEAIFMLNAGDTKARQAHSSFLKAYPHLSARDVPLLLFNRASASRPFTDVS